MIVHPAQHFFLLGLVDYAGLFPPAALSLEQTLEHYRKYQRGQAPSLLGRLVCNAGRLSQLVPLLAPDDALRISALLEHPSQVELVEAFHQSLPASVRVDTVECLWSQPEDWMRAWNYHLFFEVKGEQVSEAAAFCARSGGRAGLKLRTGALKPEGIPPVEEVADFLEQAHRFRVAYKFTAGLHHARAGVYALTYESDSPSARLYGFVPLFGLACLHWFGRLTSAELRAGLASDLCDMQVDEHGLEYLGRRVSPGEIEEFRSRGARSFGSCSFAEPLQELHEMGWLC